MIFLAVMLAACSDYDCDKYTRQYTVAYDGNTHTGGEPPEDSQTYYYTFAVTVKDQGNLVKEGYTFACWNTRADGNGTDRIPGADFAMGRADIILFAKWTLNPTYTVTYDANNGSGSAPVDLNHYLPGATVIVHDSGSLAKTGYTFTSWNTLADGGGIDRTPGSIFTMGSANVILYAQWTLNPTYTVIYDPNGGSGSVPVDTNHYLPGATVTVKSNLSLTRTGYTFAGWNTKADGSGIDRVPDSIFTMGSSNVALYAKWTLNPTYHVIYNPNGGVGSVPEDTNNYLPGATVTVKDGSTLTRPCYTFTGWNTKADGSGTALTVGSTFSMGSADATLYAQWTEIPLSTWYEDADDDGYGNPGITQAACLQPDGFVANGDDCDDGNGSVNPGAAEICDGIDNNCSGGIDEGCAGECFTGQTKLCPLQAGVCLNVQQTCGSDGAWMACDYGPNYNTIDICGDGLDNDCDGDTDEAGCVPMP
jgi:uncharacterized repeat protein (TIGR02543 family)